MQLPTSDTVAIISLIVALIAAGIALATWLFPRRPPKAATPTYEGEINTSDKGKFAKFIEQNDGNIVSIKGFLPYDEKNATNLSEHTNEVGGLMTMTNTLMLHEGTIDGHALWGGIELGIENVEGSRSAPFIFANGNWHLRGYFLVQANPGIFQGWRSITLTEVPAQEMVLRG